MAAGAVALTNVNLIISLALSGLNSILTLVGEIKSQGGLTDDQILAHAESVTEKNSQLYLTLLAALANAPAPPAAPPANPPA